MGIIGSPINKLMKNLFLFSNFFDLFIYFYFLKNFYHDSSIKLSEQTQVFYESNRIFVWKLIKVSWWQMKFNFQFCQIFRIVRIFSKFWLFDQLFEKTKIIHESCRIFVSEFSEDVWYRIKIRLSILFIVSSSEKYFFQNFVITLRLCLRSDYNFLWNLLEFLCASCLKPHVPFSILSKFSNDGIFLQSFVRTLELPFLDN